jgi:ubiquitin-protein ligase E3 C
LFTILIPAAADKEILLTQDNLSKESGKTYFLANIATFGITGGMLARYGTKESIAWIKVVSTLLKGVEDGWGKWAEGIPEEDEDEPMVSAEVDSDDEDEPLPQPKTIASFFPSANIPPPSRPKRRRRTPLPANVTSKLVLLTSSNHLSTLVAKLIATTNKSPTSLLVEYAVFADVLLRTFRGSARWEAILEALMAGANGRGLIRRLWREGVRGKWSSDSKQNWETFSQSKYIF